MNEKILAFHFDMKRAMWKRTYMEMLSKQLKKWGYNTIIYEVEDKLKFTNHPAIAHKEALTHEQMSSFVAWARDNGLDVIPAVQTLGHVEYIVANPEYNHLRESPEVNTQLCPLNEEARSLIIELCDEVIDVFRPKQFFHIGGDETRALGRCEKCAEFVRTSGNLKSRQILITMSVYMN